ncbi:MAG TPA: hypothetical protein VGJ92_07560 [Methanocella sp.]
MRSIIIATLGVFVVLTIIGLAQLTGIANAQEPRSSIAGKSPDVMVISGLPDFQALAYGKNQLSIAVVPVSQQDNRMTFKVKGLAVSYPGTAPAIVYTLSEPMPGSLDLSQKTLDVDLTNFNTAASEPEHIEKSRVSHVLQTNANTTIIEVTMDYKSLQGSEAIFRVSSISLIPPDGQMQTYRLELPKQLIIDGDAKRLYMV